MGLCRTSAGCVALCAVGVVASLRAQTSITAALSARERSGVVTASSTDASGAAVQPLVTSLEGALRSASAAAAVIFAGEVVSIDRTPGAVSVRWRVEHAIAGATAGAVYEQKEWPGLWATGDARYRVGERALVLLHAPSVAGYTTPVADGVIPLRGDVITGTLDLRWLATQVPVTDAARLRPMQALRAAGGDFALSDALLSRSARVAKVPRALGQTAINGIEANGGSVVVTGLPAVSTEDANAHVDGAMVLGMLHAWRQAETVSQ